MRYSSVIVAASALAGFAVAQNSTTNPNLPIPCCTVPVNNVPQSQRDSWCDAQENTCIDICGGDPSDIGSNGNTCDASTLQYTCSCANGTSVTDPTMRLYEQTVPGQMCIFWYDACINATIGTNGEGDRTQQTACREARASQCGTLKFDESDNDTDSSTASASGTATRSSSGSATGTGASSTATGTAATTSGAAVANLALGTPILAGGLLAVFGLAL